MPLVAEQDKMTVKHAEATTKAVAAQKAVADVESQAAASRDRAKVLSEVAARAQDAVKKIPKDKEDSLTPPRHLPNVTRPPPLS